MKAKRCQISASIYDGEVQILYDCPGLCAFALCSVMPPNGSEDCVYRKDGTCLLIAAKMAAIETLYGVLRRELKALQEQINE